ncbi:MAG: T9SS type A sorting domain-containing protein [Bacteroidales bacterium]|nr:T9SS type A sorting domain-containing protein [Bacteroidales bacterium]
MKKSYTLLIFIFCFLLQGYGQCIKEQISTDPTNPVNNEIPAMKNYFDWMQPSFQLNSSEININPIASPFYQVDNDIINHFVDSKDYLPIDGWELIKKDFGYNGTGIVTSPYLILYNRFSGILRCFVAMKQVAGYNAAKFTLSFTSASPDRTHSLSSIGTPLDKQIGIPEISVPTAFTNDPGKWFYADFAMNYDPCICNANSKLLISVDLIRNSSIDMKGFYEGTLVSIDNGNINKINTGSSLSLKNIGSSFEKGQKVYNSIEKLKNEQLKNVLSKSQYWNNWVNSQAVHLDDLSLADLDYFVQTNTLESFVTTEYNFFKDKLNLFQKELISDNFLKTGLRAAPYIGAAFSFIDAFISGGRQATSPQPVKLMPMSINMNATYSGTITTDLPYRDIIFYNPGTSASTMSNYNEYPYYNNGLGVMNLVETPKVDVQEDINYWYEPDTWANIYDIQWKFRMNANQIKYIINPNAGVKDSAEIFAQLIFQFTTDQGYGATLDFGNSPIIDFQNPEFNKYFYYSKPMPLSFYNDLTINAQASYTTQYTELVSVSLKLFFNFKRSDNLSNAQNIFYVSTFPTIINKVSSVAQGSLSSIPNYKTFYEQGNKTIVSNEKAWETIEVRNTTLSSASNFYLSASNIILKNGAVIKPGITIKAGDPIGVIPVNISPIPVSNIDCLSRYPLRSSKKNNTDNDNIKVFPNPFNEQLRIEDLNNSIATINLFDLQGRLIYSTKEVSSSNTINTSEYPLGVYILKLYTKNGPIIKKIIKSN